MQEFISTYKELLQKRNWVKMTISKPRSKQAPIKNIYLRPILLKDDYQVQVVERSTTQDFTKNLSPEDALAYISDQLAEHFYMADLIAEGETIHLLQSQKGKVKIIRKKSNHTKAILAHDRKKERHVDISSGYLKDLGIVSSKNKIYGHAQDKYKQIDKYLDILYPLIKAEFPTTIYDMGSGKGYLTMALYDFLKGKGVKPHITGIELRPDLVEKCNTIAKTHHMDGLSFAEGSIDSYTLPKTDMVIALHACDIATDMAIAQGIQAEAKYIVVAPCCQKQIRKEMTSIVSPLSAMLKHGILLERQAEMVTDGIRALLLESRGYETKVQEFISSEHTGKNIMITARYTGNKSASALKEIESIKQSMGIQSHYLEKLLS